MNERRIEKIIDILALTEDEFERFLPDFSQWFFTVKAMKDFPLSDTAMIWIDDGENKLKFLEITNPKTGENQRIEK